MTQFEVVKSFVEIAKRTRKDVELFSGIEDAIRELDFQYFAILHHVDVGRGIKGLVRYNNYPSSFIERTSLQKYYLDDPVLMAAQMTARGFLWSEVPSLMPLSARQREIISLGAKVGLGDGYTVPLHVPGEFAASCSYGVEIQREVPNRNLPYLHYLSAFAFESAWRIARGANREPVGRTFTARQLDCIVLAGRGFSAREIGLALGVRADTVEKHLEDARARAGVSTTTQLIVRSLFEGSLSFNDVLISK